jgi:tRNA (5-methylaminomethyl-2-thiouridylate)-methyltransferase
MKIAVLVSGGVDSSVALRLLHEQGHELTAYYVKIWLEDELSYLGECPWEDDLRYARQVCSEVGVPLHVIPLQKAYADEVLNYTLHEIRNGYTPSPDIMCNQRIKFGAFRSAIQDEGAFIATGHYAKKVVHKGIAYLIRSPDAIKDQTYFLARLSVEQLNSALFPLGDFTKDEVRRLAERYRLPNYDRPDSQGICFLGKITFSQFLEHHLGVQEGPLINYETGERVGTHRGYWFYTTGQRQGIGLSGGPWYVVGKSCHNNSVYISRNYRELNRERSCFWIRDMHWLDPNMQERITASEGYNLTMKLRHGPQFHSGNVRVDAHYPDRLWVQLASSDQGIAPGQFSVLYEGERCMGSGIMMPDITFSNIHVHGGG